MGRTMQKLPDFLSVFISIANITHARRDSYPDHLKSVIKRPARDACLSMGELQAPAAPHFIFLITL